MIETKRLADVAKVIRGVSFDKIDAVDDHAEGYLPILRAGNIQDILILDQELIWVKNSKVAKEQLIQQGDTAICMSSGSQSLVGKTSFAPINFEGSVGAFCAIIRPNPEFLNPLFLYFYTKSCAYKRWTDSAQGAGIKNIKKSSLESLHIPCPSLEDQNMIVSILKEADNVLKLKREISKKNQELIDSVFFEIFGDIQSNSKGFPKTNLSTLCESTSRRDPRATPNQNFSYIDIGAINNISGKITAEKYLPGKDAPSRARQIVKTGDIIVSTVRPNLKGTALVTERFDDQICSTGFCVLRPKNPDSSDFIYSLVRSNWFVTELMKRARGAQYPAVSDIDIFSLPVINPPLETQKKYMNKLRQIEKVKNLQEETIEIALELYLALLDRMFPA